MVDDVNKAGALLDTAYSSALTRVPDAYGILARCLARDDFRLASGTHTFFYLVNPLADLCRVAHPLDLDSEWSILFGDLAVARSPQSCSGYTRQVQVDLGDDGGTIRPFLLSLADLPIISPVPRTALLPLPNPSFVRA